MKRFEWAAILLMTGLGAGLGPGAAEGAVINVPGNFASIQGAIDAAAVSGDEIVVAAGTYFEVIDFSGKAINLHSASGNPADTIIDGTGFPESVVLCIGGEGPGTILEGFTITGGTGHGVGGFGGGMHNLASSPTVMNCIFSGNLALQGGGVANFAGSNPTMIDCTFSGNTADGGGGMINNELSNPALTNCLFLGNTASFGGGISNFLSDPGLINCLFSGNSALVSGGGISNFTSSPSVVNCTFSGNSAFISGGGMYNLDNSNATVINSIFWGDSPEGIFNEVFPLSSPTVSFSDVGGGLPTGTVDGGGNISVNPRFVDANGEDGIAGTSDDDLRLRAFSPGVDAGDNTAAGLIGITTDLAGGPRFVDDAGTADTGVGTPGAPGGPIVDMGVFERQVVSCRGDVAPPGGDGVISILDIAVLLDAFGDCPAPPSLCESDITPPGPPVGNGVVNIDDLVEMLRGFGGCE